MLILKCAISLLLKKRSKIKIEKDRKPIITTLLLLNHFRIVLGGFYLYLLSRPSFDHRVRKEYVNTLCKILTLKENIKKNDPKKKTEGTILTPRYPDT